MILVPVALSTASNCSPASPQPTMKGTNMRPTIPTELPNWGFVIDLDPDKDAHVHVITVRAEKVLNADGITTPLVDDILTIQTYILDWGAKSYSEQDIVAIRRPDNAPAIDDLDRIKLLVHTAATLVCQAQMILAFEQEDEESDWPQQYNKELARTMLVSALRAIGWAFNSARSSRKEKIW